jgi:hypothetical protein
MEPWAGTVEQYADFAEHASDSPCFAAWARAVADDPEVLAWIATLPTVKQQPNLVFAAARWHGVPAPGPYARLRAALLADDGSIRATILARATQTNESGRLATLVPAFARAAAAAGGGPVALLEVGASAGLCLYPDRYSYTWRTGAGLVQTGAGPELTCEVAGAFEGPVAVPEVAWRGGVDLHPLDVTDTDQMAWLATLVWPEHDDRRAQLLTAIDVARSDPPRLVRGDLLTELPGLVERASAHAPVVVFHSAVIAYLEDADRRRFHELMTGLVADGACHWVSNESPRVLPAIAGDRRGPVGRFALGVDGRLVAWTHGHGRSMEWLAS